MRLVVTLVALAAAATAIASEELDAKRDELHRKLNTVKWRRKALVLPFVDKTEGQKADVAGVRGAIEQLFRDTDYEIVAAADAPALGAADDATLAELCTRYGAGTIVGGTITQYAGRKVFNPLTLPLPGGGMTNKARIKLNTWVYRYDQGKVCYTYDFANAHTSRSHGFGAWRPRSRKIRHATEEAIAIAYDGYLRSWPGLGGASTTSARQ